MPSISRRVLRVRVGFHHENFVIPTPGVIQRVNVKGAEGATEGLVRFPV